MDVMIKLIGENGDLEREFTTSLDTVPRVEETLARSCYLLDPTADGTKIVRRVYTVVDVEWQLQEWQIQGASAGTLPNFAVVTAEYAFSEVL